jgi:5-oxoprolinase (ATP-hydrolysing)
MTNTRITDPEILEIRYPVLLREFNIRANSGGEGKFKGGDGVIREIEFLKDNIQVGMISERRAFEPYGMEGGSNGARGKNLILHPDGRS